MAKVKDENRAIEVGNTVAKMVESKVKERPRRRGNRRQRRTRGVRRRRNNNRRPRTKNDGLGNKPIITQPLQPNRFTPPSSLMTIQQMIDGTNLHRYVEAQIDPFSPAAFGAHRPDLKSGMKFPACDQFLKTLVPKYYLNAGGTTQVLSFALVFMPRNLATGWVGGPETIATVSGNTQITQQPEIPFTMYDSSGEIIEPEELYGEQQTAVKLPIQDPYSLWVIPITTDGWAVRRATPQEFSNGGDEIVAGYNIFRYPRVESYAVSAAGTRILGAGIKVQATAPPIETGGYCYAGNIKPKDIYTLFKKQLNAIKNFESVGPFGTFKNLILQRRGFKAIQGVTARYVPLNDTKQMDFEPTRILFPPISYTDFPAPPQPGKHKKKTKTSKTNDLYFELDDGDDIKSSCCTKCSNKIKSVSVAPTDRFDLHFKVLPDLDLAVNDLCGPDDPVPVLFFEYSFEAGNGSETPTTVNSYNLEFRSRVHVENEPIGDSALVSVDVSADPALQVVEDFVGNPSNVEVSASGNSFKSFFSKFGKFAGHVGKWASRAEKIGKILLG